MEEVSQKATETNQVFIIIPDTTCSNNSKDFKSEEKKYNNSKNLPNGKQLIEKINKKCKSLNPYEYNI